VGAASAFMEKNGRAPGRGSGTGVHRGRRVANRVREEALCPAASMKRPTVRCRRNPFPESGAAGRDPEAAGDWRRAEPGFPAAGRCAGGSPRRPAAESRGRWWWCGRSWTEGSALPCSRKPESPRPKIQLPVGRANPTVGSRPRQASAFLLYRPATAFPSHPPCSRLSASTTTS
jgi:hypothetical protein